MMTDKDSLEMDLERARGVKSAAKACLNVKDYAQAEQHCREALGLYAQLVDSEKKECLGDYVFVLELLSKICKENHREAEALAADWELLELLRTLAQLDRVTYLDLLVQKLEEVALACERRHEVFAALGFMMEALRLAEDLPQAWKDAGNPLERMKAELTRMDALQDEIEVGGEWIYKDYPKNYFKR